MKFLILLLLFLPLKASSTGITSYTSSKKHGTPLELNQLTIEWCHFASYESCLFFMLGGTLCQRVASKAGYFKSSNVKPANNCSK